LGVTCGPNAGHASSIQFSIITGEVDCYDVFDDDKEIHELLLGVVTQEMPKQLIDPASPINFSNWDSDFTVDLRTDRRYGSCFNEWLEILLERIKSEPASFAQWCQDHPDLVTDHVASGDRSHGEKRNRED
jgi:hypothetical protein